MNVLITGAASGIGGAAAKYFVRQGHQVFGIDVAPMEKRDGFCPFTADITDEAALLGVKEQLKTQQIQLDAIVNVAGMHMMASLVESNFERMKKLMDINIIGTMLVNRVFHEILAEKGRVVIVTSEVASLDPLPFNGLYSVSKTALETYAQALRQELNLIGQKVVTIRPGAVETPLSHGSMKATADLAQNTRLYQKQAKNFSGIAAKFMGKPIAPQKLAALLYKAVTAKHPKLTYKKHRNAGLVLLSILPKRWQCGIIKLLLRMNLF